MPLNNNNSEADALTREFAVMTGLSITEAVVVAMKEAIASRRATESPEQTARLRGKYGISTRPTMQQKLRRQVLDDMWNDRLHPKP